MNKLIVIYASLVIAVPVVAMEIALVDTISQKEDETFVSNVLKAVECNKQLVEKKIIGEDNAIHLILDNLSRDLAIHKNLVSMLRSTQYKPVLSMILVYRLNAYDQIETVKKSTEEIKISLARACQFSAEDYLAERCPQYKKMSYCSGRLIYSDRKACVHHFDKWGGGGNYLEEGEYLMVEDTIDFMVENANFLKVDDEKEKQARIEKYIANILYQEIFVKQID